MTKPPSPNVRLTITVTPEVHAAFQRMSEVTGVSIGRCMGEWLGDTLEGVEMITGQLAKAREAPRQVVAEMRQWALGAVDQADELLASLRQRKLPLEQPQGAAGGAPRAGGRLPAPEAPSPRPVIRGGKSGGKTRTTRSSSTRGGKS